MTTENYLTSSDLDEIKEGVRTSLKLESLDSELKKHAKRTDDNTTAILSKLDRVSAAVADYPLKMSQCKSEIRDDIYEHVDKHYVTKGELETIRAELRGDMRVMSTKITVTVSVIMALISIVQIAVSLYVMLDKLKGGV